MRELCRFRLNPRLFGAGEEEVEVRRSGDGSRQGLGLVSGSAGAVGTGLRGAVGILEVHGRHLASAVLLQVIADALVLAERAHAAAFQGADVNEGVLPTAVGSNEAIALAVVEEFHGSGGHNLFLLVRDRTASPSARRGMEKERRSRKAPKDRQVATDSRP